MTVQVVTQLLLDQSILRHHRLLQRIKSTRTGNQVLTQGWLRLPLVPVGLKYWTTNIGGKELIVTLFNQCRTTIEQHSTLQEWEQLIII